MQSYANQSPSNRQPYRSVTVFEAAQILGISPEAVRARIKRGTLTKDKAPDGTVYVRLDAEQSQRIAEELGNGMSDQPQLDGHLTDMLREQINAIRDELEDWKRETEDWKEEARRKDAIIMSLTQRIPELESAREDSPQPRESPVSDSETEAEGAVPQESAEREIRQSWWRRLFGG